MELTNKQNIVRRLRKSEIRFNFTNFLKFFYNIIHFDVIKTQFEGIER